MVLHRSMLITDSLVRFNWSALGPYCTYMTQLLQVVGFLRPGHILYNNWGEPERAPHSRMLHLPLNGVSAVCMRAVLGPWRPSRVVCLVYNCCVHYNFVTSQCAGEYTLGVHDIAAVYTLSYLPAMPRRALASTR